MKKTMLVGKTGCGKTTLIQAIQGRTITYKKTQAVSFCDDIIDTPGEFVENRRFYSALMATSTPCEIIGLVQDATANNSIFPPKFGSMFNKPIIGVISKTDMEGCNLARAEKFLKWAGAQEIFLTSSIDNIGIKPLLDHLSQ